MTPRGRRWIPLLAAGAWLAACASPEATRVRGGGPGADAGNRGTVVEIHAGAKIYYKTPCRTAKVKCSGPVPDAGT